MPPVNPKDLSVIKVVEAPSAVSIVTVVKILMLPAAHASPRTKLVLEFVNALRRTVAPIAPLTLPGWQLAAHAHFSLNLEPLTPTSPLTVVCYHSPPQLTTPSSILALSLLRAPLSLEVS